MRVADTGQAFLAVCGAALGEEAGANNLLLSIAAEESGGPCRFVWLPAGADGSLPAMGQRPVGHQVVLSATSAVAARRLAKASLDTGLKIPGVIGEARAAAAFAGEWMLRADALAVPLEGQRIYELGTDVHVPVDASGSFDRASERDLGRLVELSTEADAESGVVRPPGHDYRTELGAACAASLAWVWRGHGGLQSMCFATSPVAGVSRLRGVYTPPEHRGHGCGTALMARAAADLWERGVRPILYAQFTNPAANRIYERLGFRVVCDVLRFRFDQA